MARIAVGGFQHETNTFAPTRADYAAFESGGGWPPLTFGDAIAPRLEGANIPATGAIAALHAAGHDTVGLAWGAASPSAQVTKDAYERIGGEIVRRLAAAGPVDGVYLDLHGAMVAEHVDDGEGELLARVRKVVGPRVPVVASLDLHANVTRAMLDHSDGLVAYRTYPHVDMAATGERAAAMLDDLLRRGAPLAKSLRTLDFLTGIPSQCTTIEPGKRLYAMLERLEHEHGTVLSFTPGFPMADFDECGMAVFGMGPDEARVQVAVAALRQAVADAEGEFHLELFTPDEAVRRAVRNSSAGAPVVLADTQDNPGAGGDSNTTGMLHALVAQGAGRRYPGQVALGMMYDAAAARAAHEAGEGAEIDITLGTSVPTFAGMSDAPLRGRFKVVKLSDGVCTLEGPMMTGLTVRLGPSACLEIDGVRVAVVSGKKQLLDRALLRMVGVTHEQMRIVVVKSSNHFRADFQPHASHVLVAKAVGPMAADPSDLPWKKLPASIRRHP
jgi:microcystin degradation protein MlrC